LSFIAKYCLSKVNLGRQPLIPPSLIQVIPGALLACMAERPNDGVLRQIVNVDEHFLTLLIKEISKSLRAGKSFN
jgi:hypothetical protein